MGRYLPGPSGLLSADTTQAGKSVPCVIREIIGMPAVAGIQAIVQELGDLNARLAVYVPMALQGLNDLPLWPRT
jgi:hypothetical protein